MPFRGKLVVSGLPHQPVSHPARSPPLPAVFERCEYWRLRDGAGKPAGLLGWWPSRTVTFLENHDTVGGWVVLWVERWGWWGEAVGDEERRGSGSAMREQQGSGSSAARLRCIPYLMTRSPPAPLILPCCRAPARATGASPTTRWSRGMPTS